MAYYRIVLDDGGDAHVNEADPVEHGPVNVISGLENVMLTFVYHVMRRRFLIRRILPRSEMGRFSKVDVRMFVFSVG